MRCNTLLYLLAPRLRAQQSPAKLIIITDTLSRWATNSLTFFKSTCRLTAASYVCSKLAAILLHHWKLWWTLIQRYVSLLEGGHMSLPTGTEPWTMEKTSPYPEDDDGRSLALQLGSPTELHSQILSSSLLLWKGISTCFNFITTTSCWLFFGWMWEGFPAPSISYIQKTSHYKTRWSETRHLKVVVSLLV